jgi:hypothetical protein
MRKFIIPTLGAFLIFTGITGTADAANHTDSSFGISIDIDDNLSKQPLVRDIQPFVSQDGLVSIVIRRAYDLSITDFVDQLRHVGYRDSRHQVTLRVDGEPVEANIDSGRGLLIPVRGMLGAQPISGVIGAYSSNSGHGFLIIGTAITQYWPQWEPRMKAMFENVKFVEVDTEAMVKEWQDRLKGKKLQYSGYAPGGMYYYSAPVQQNYNLCSDGTLIRESAATGQAAGQTPGQSMMVYGQGMNQGRGTWQVEVFKGEPFLVVRDGPELGFRLEYEGDAFLLDSRPYTITNSDRCK